MKKKPEPEVTKGELEQVRKDCAEVMKELYGLRVEVEFAKERAEENRALYERATYDLRRAEARVDALQFALVLAQEYAKKHQDESVRLKAEMKRLFKESRDTVALAS